MAAKKKAVKKAPRLTKEQQKRRDAALKGAATRKANAEAAEAAAKKAEAAAKRAATRKANKAKAEAELKKAAKKR